MRGSALEISEPKEAGRTMRVNCTRHAVGNLEMKLGDGVFCGRIDSETPKVAHSTDRHTGVEGGVADVTNGRRLDHVPYSEALDGLVLGDAARAVGAAHGVNVAAVLLVAAAGSSLLGLQGIYQHPCVVVVECDGVVP